MLWASAGSVYRYPADVSAQMLVQVIDILFIAKRKENGLANPVKVRVLWSTYKKLDLGIKGLVLQVLGWTYIPIQNTHSLRFAFCFSNCKMGGKTKCFCFRLTHKKMISLLFLLYSHHNPHSYSAYKVSNIAMLGLCLLMVIFWMQNKVLPLVYLCAKKTYILKTSWGNKRIGWERWGYFVLCIFQQDNLKVTYEKLYSLKDIFGALHHQGEH